MRWEDYVLLLTTNIKDEMTFNERQRMEKQTLRGKV
jgi:hypothetical protein